MKEIRKILSIAALLWCIVPVAVFAAGNKEAPQIGVQASGTQYLSPNGDGVKDSAVMSFTVKLRVKSQKGFVPEYGLTIQDSSGTVVRTVKETEKSDLGWFMKLFTGYKEFTLSKTITWDGKNDSGQLVPDGTYKAILYVVDANGNRQTADLSNFVVDTRAPEVSISLPAGTLFSPNGDGNMDTLQIDQSGGSVEQLWTGTFTSEAGSVVRTIKWENSAPVSFAWDGKDDSGRVVPNGTYTYSISSTDLAGNRSQDYRLPGIRVDSAETPVSLTLSEPYISPNGDGIKDSTSARLAVSAKGKVVSWTLSLKDSQGKIVRQIEGTGEPPGSVPFAGTDAQGRVFPDGSYDAIFRAVFQNGNVATSEAPLVINITPPRLALSLSNPYFSPNGDGIKDTTRATLSVSTGQPIDKWQARLELGGKVVAHAEGAGAPPPSVQWDGKDLSGKPAPEGSYRVDVSVTLRDGTSAQTSAPVVLDLTPPRVEVAASTPLFTPNSSDARNTEVISINSSEPVTWQGTLADAAGRTILTANQPMSLQQVRLDKSVAEVAAAPDGVYRLRLTFSDRAGNRTTSSPVSITLINHPISTRIATGPGFSPNADGVDDELTAAIRTSSTSSVSKWDIAVLDSSGAVVANYPGTGSLPSEFRWNGVIGQASGKKLIAPDGSYTLRLTASYENGLTDQAVSNSFVIDDTPPRIAAQASSDAFIVTRGGLEGRVFASVRVSDASPIASWTLDVLNPDGSLLRHYGGKGDPSQETVWRGTLPLPGSEPAVVSSYPFGVRMSATDSMGNSTTLTARIPVEAVGRLRADGKIHMLLPNVLFGLYKYALDSRSPQQGEENLRILGNVVSLLRKYPNFNLEVDGYSMEVFKPGTPEYEREEAIIIPLSANRAKTVRDALIGMGLDPSRVVARHFGGLHPLVDPLNEEIRWQNRRVEFILLPK